MKGVKVKIGIFVVVGIILFVVFLYFLGNFRFGKCKEITVVFEKSYNLKTGSAVKISGIDCGYIKSVKLDLKDPVKIEGKVYPVRVTVCVKDEYVSHLGSKTVFSVASSGVLGERFIEIEPDLSGRGEIGSVVWGRGAGGMQEIFAKVNGMFLKIDRILKGFDPSFLKQVSVLLKDFSKKSDELAGRVSKTLGKIDTLLDELNTIAVEKSAKLDTVLNELSDVLKTLKNEGVILSRKSMRLIGKIDKRIDDFSDLVPFANSMKVRFAKILSSLEQFLKTVNKKDGFLSLILTDKELYFDIRELVREIKENPWKVLYKE